MHIKNAYKTDLEIVEGLRNDDDLAFKILYKQYYSIISRFVLTNNGNDQEAKDIFQDSIIVFYEKVKDRNFKLECKIITYLYSVSRRLWLNELKIKGKNAGDINDLENFIIFSDSIENTFREKEKQIELLSESLEMLGEPCSTIINDFYIFRLSMQQIADKMGYTNFENAKNQKYKCLQRLKKIYFKSYDLNKS